MQFSDSPSKGRFRRELEKVLDELGNEYIISVRTSGPVARPEVVSTELDLRLVCSLRKEKEIFFLILLTYHLSEYGSWIRVLIAEQLVNRISNIENRDLLRQACCLNKEEFLDFLVSQSIFFITPEELFGWIGQNKKFKLKIAYSSYSMSLLANLVKIQHQRQRHHNDQGSLGKNAITPTEISSDSEITKLSNLIEERRKRIEETNLAIIRYYRMRQV